MPYSDNLLVTSGATWSTIGASIGSVITIGQGGSISTSIPKVDFIVEPFAFLLSVVFDSVANSDLLTTVACKANVKLTYLDGSFDQILIPLDKGKLISDKYNVSTTINTKENVVLTQIDLSIRNNSTQNFVIHTISLQQELTDVQAHDLDTSPHQLPLSITVGPNGIKAMKDGGVSFWLHDNGDAEYKGTITGEQLVAGKLESTNRKCVFDLDNATFNLDDKFVYDGNSLSLKFSDTQTYEDKINQVEANVTYKVDIISTNGMVFKNGVINTTLIARVYKGSVDVTDTLDSSKFKWTRVSDDAVGDTSWNTSHFGGAKQITITRDDVFVRATFTCEISN